MTNTEIIQTLQNGTLTLDELGGVQRVLEGAIRDAQQAEHDRKAKADPIDLMPSDWDWGCYSVEDSLDTPKAVAALNKVGIKLVKAVRSESLPAVRMAIKAVIREQEVWSRCGAADTEGREAIWTVIKNSCAGTGLNAESVWKSCYDC